MKTINKRDLNEKELQAVSERRAYMESMLGGEGEEHRSAAEKLTLLQMLFDRKALLKEQGFDVASMGVLLGDALCQVLGLKWVMVEDEDGCEPAVCYPGTAIFSFPLSAVQKRFEAEGEVNVFYFFVLMAEKMGKMQRSFEYETD